MVGAGEDIDTRSGPRRFASSLAEFLRTEASGGVLLVLATLAALVWANSPWSGSYQDLWHYELTLGVGRFSVTEDLGHWVNDGLMAVFFFVVGLEIKRELVVGELRDPKAASLPVLAALGGMVVPALLFVLIAGGGEAGRGWGIPMATDIAFVVGVLALLGPRVPAGLKLFLLTLAIVDDLGAIGVIAVFYSAGVDGAWLAGAAVSLVLVVVARRLGVRWPLAYVPLALVAWVCTLESGVHATVAGVALGLLTPARPVDGRPVLEELEHRLHPWSSFVIVPVFALANAGVDLGGGAIASALGGRAAWAVIVGLVAGKTLGIGALTALGLRLRVGRLPEGVRFGHIVGAGALAGIGFTVSLFVTGLAFESPDLIAEAKIGILAASLLAGALGTLLLLAQQRAPDPE
ncbi:MAG: Na+/H+ antiporter NhaA [Actinobacteria bacterium]|nr:Na+/H+ antiporter NhaA [Actinomycetota bacterium]